MKEMIFDGEPPITSQQCMLCTRFVGPVRGVATGKCEAFAEIPLAIWLSEFEHSRPYPGDGGVRFEPMVISKAKSSAATY